VRWLLERGVGFSSDVLGDAGTCTRGAKGLELRLAKDGTIKCHTTAIAK